MVHQTQEPEDTVASNWQHPQAGQVRFVLTLTCICWWAGSPSLADIPDNRLQSTAEDGFLVHQIESPLQSGTTQLYVLMPETIEPQRMYPLLVVLPVEPGRSRRWGDPLQEIRRQNLHNSHGLVCAMPTFSDLPWYADHPDKPGLQQETYVLSVILPLLEKAYPQVSSDPKDRHLLGFSKSGWGAWSLLLRNPDSFGRAAAWDAPLAMSWPSRFGSQPIFGSEANFRKFQVTRLLQTSGPRLGDQPRLIHLGFGNFREHHERIANQLNELGLPHIYRDGPKRDHRWDSGWLSEAVALLMEDESPAAESPASSTIAWEQIAEYFDPPPEYVGDPGDYRSPLLFEDGTRVQTAEDWKRRREELLTTWNALLGKWPPLLTDQELTVHETTRREEITQHRVRFQWTPNESTSGYLLIPPGTGRRPAVMTVYYEPETAIGLGKPNRDFAIQLARRGFVTLSIGTTEATAAQTYGLYYPSLQEAEVQPLSMLACAAANAWHALANRPEVDPERIGIVGHSFGGKWAMFAACLFDRFACAAWSDPGIVFDESRPSVNYWEPWYLGYHPKPWRRRGLITPENPAKGLYPRLTSSGRNLHELHALMAPRPFLVSGGSEDPESRWQALNHTVAVNRLLGYENRVAMTNRPEHAPDADSNAVIYAFFEHFLGPTN